MPEQDREGRNRGLVPCAALGGVKRVQEGQAEPGSLLCVVSREFGVQQDDGVFPPLPPAEGSMRLLGVWSWELRML